MIGVLSGQKLIMSRIVRFSDTYGSHSRAVLSRLAVASSRPSGLNATPQTWPVTAAG